MISNVLARSAMRASTRQVVRSDLYHFSNSNGQVRKKKKKLEKKYALIVKYLISNEYNLCVEHSFQHQEQNCSCYQDDLVFGCWFRCSFLW